MRLFRRPTPGGNNYEIPLTVVVFLAAVLLLELAVVVYRVVTYPERQP
jgi:hypothetical protein